MGKHLITKVRETSLYPEVLDSQGSVLKVTMVLGESEYLLDSKGS